MFKFSRVCVISIVLIKVAQTGPNFYAVAHIIADPRDELTAPSEGGGAIASPIPGPGGSTLLRTVCSQRYFATDIFFKKREHPFIQFQAILGLVKTMAFIGL